VTRSCSGGRKLLRMMQTWCPRGWRRTCLSPAFCASPALLRSAVKMMDNMFLKADGSGRSLFCLCGSCLATGSVAASGFSCPAEFGMICGCRLLVASRLHGTLITASGGMSGGIRGQSDPGRWQKMAQRA